MNENVIQYFYWSYLMLSRNHILLYDEQRSEEMATVVYSKQQGLYLQLPIMDVLWTRKGTESLNKSHCPPNLGTSQVALVVKKPPAKAGDLKKCGCDPWVGKLPWRREGMATHFSILAWWATIHRVTRSWTPLKRFSTAQPRNLACHLGILNIQMIIKWHSILRESFLSFLWGGVLFLHHRIILWRNGDL